MILLELYCDSYDALDSVLSDEERKTIFDPKLKALTYLLQLTNESAQNLSRAIRLCNPQTAASMLAALKPGIAQDAVVRQCLYIETYMPRELPEWIKDIIQAIAEQAEHPADDSAREAAISTLFAVASHSQINPLAREEAFKACEKCLKALILSGASVPSEPFIFFGERLVSELAGFKKEKAEFSTAAGRAVSAAEAVDDINAYETAIELFKSFTRLIKLLPDNAARNLATRSGRMLEFCFQDDFSPVLRNEISTFIIDSAIAMVHEDKETCGELAHVIMAQCASIGTEASWSFAFDLANSLPPDVLDKEELERFTLAAASNGIIIKTPLEPMTMGTEAADNKMNTDKPAAIPPNVIRYKNIAKDAFSRMGVCVPGPLSEAEDFEGLLSSLYEAACSGPELCSRIAEYSSLKEPGDYEDAAYLLFELAYFSLTHEAKETGKDPASASNPIPKPSYKDALMPKKFSPVRMSVCDAALKALSLIDSGYAAKLYCKGRAAQYLGKFHFQEGFKQISRQLKAHTHDIADYAGFLDSLTPAQLALEHAAIIRALSDGGALSLDSLKGENLNELIMLCAAAYKAGPSSEPAKALDSLTILSKDAPFETSGLIDPVKLYSRIAETLGTGFSKPQTDIDTNNLRTFIGSELKRLHAIFQEDPDLFEMEMDLCFNQLLDANTGLVKIRFENGELAYLISLLTGCLIEGNAKTTAKGYASRAISGIKANRTLTTPYPWVINTLFILTNKCGEDTASASFLSFLMTELGYGTGSLAGVLSDTETRLSRRVLDKLMDIAGSKNKLSAEIAASALIKSPVNLYFYMLGDNQNLANTVRALYETLGYSDGMPPVWIAETWARNNPPAFTNEQAFLGLDSKFIRSLIYLARVKEVTTAVSVAAALPKNTREQIARELENTGYFTSGDIGAIIAGAAALEISESA